MKGCHTLTQKGGGNNATREAARPDFDTLDGFLTTGPARRTLGLPSTVTGDLVFIGSDAGAGLDIAGKIVMRLSPVRLVPGPVQPPPPAHAAAVIGIDSAIGPEPNRWPVQYAVSMVLADAAFPAAPAT